MANHPTIDQFENYSPSDPIDELSRTYPTEMADEIGGDSPWRSFTKACWYTTTGVAQSFSWILMKSNPATIACHTLFSSLIGGTFLIIVEASRGVSPFGYHPARIEIPRLNSFACSNQNLTLLNRTIDITDHLIGLKMYKEYAELRYHYLNSTAGSSISIFTGPLSPYQWYDCGKYYLASNPLFPGEYSPYEKQLIRHFGHENKFFSINAFSYKNGNYSYIGTGLPTYHYPSAGSCLDQGAQVASLSFRAPLSSENLDWVYANLVEPDARLLHEERRAYEEEIIKKYFTPKQQKEILDYFYFLFGEQRNSMFDARLDLEEKELIKRREELRYNMTPVLRDYQGIDLKQCWEMSLKKYNDATREAKNKEREREDSHRNWERSLFMIGFGGSFLTLARMMVEMEMHRARNQDDHLMRVIDHSFYQASQATKNLKISMGLVARPLPEKLVFLKQAQQRDTALCNLINRTLNSDHIVYKDQILQIAQSLLDAISARIRARANIIQEWEARINERRRSFSFVQAEEVLDAPHNE